MDDDGRPRRSLIMAGGGTKVAFQAGVLQVWLDEAGISFDHADGASGGVLNLAMWCQQMSGRQMAENWRTHAPLRALEPNLTGLVGKQKAQSLLRLGRFRRNVLDAWGLDFDAIRSTPREATFNLYNFSRHRHEVLTAAEMDEDRLVSAVSLPMWFPPVDIDGDTYIDAVFATDANLMAAVERGADEIWVVWTVSERGEWHGGFVAHYFQMIEAMANVRFKEDLARIERSNAELAQGRPCELGRHVEVKVLRAEVPLHYLLNLTNDRMAAAVELGVRTARDWCRQEGVVLDEASSPAPLPVGSGQLTTVSFTEVMAGHVGFGAVDPTQGAELGRDRGTDLSFRLTISVEDLARFVIDPEHSAIARGEVVCDQLGGHLAVEDGSFNLFVDQGRPEVKRMLYRLWFRDQAQNPLTLAGHKVIQDHPGLDLWADTTTLYTRVVAGHVSLTEAEGDSARVVAAGIIRITPWAFARQLATFRSTGPGRCGPVPGLLRFGRLFVGSLWDVYGRAVLSSSPI